MKTKILVVDDDRSHRLMLKTVLEAEEYRVFLASDGDSALESVRNSMFDVILMDIRMAGMDGLEVLKHLRGLAVKTPVVLMTAYASIKTAVEALRNGADDYLTKPLDMDELKVVLEKMLRLKVLQDENHQLREELGREFDFSSVIGSSPKMKSLFEMIKLVAPSEATILLRGESGTGKELIARMIHQNSPRKNGPFIAVNCAAIPETLLESELFGHERGAFTGANRQRMGRFGLADGGTLLLDEIGEMPVQMQAKLLRVLQDQVFEPLGSTKSVKTNIRFIAATHRDLQEEIEAGRFREDLYYRLNVVALELPPLRERPGDILLLAHHFLEAYSRKNQKLVKTMASEVADTLARYDWPGNVRELENVMERSIILARSTHLRLEDLPEFLRNQRSKSVEKSFPQVLPDRTLKDMEEEMIRMTLAQHQGNRTQAAKTLGISRRTLQLKLKAYGVK